MKFSNAFIPTQRQAPNDAEVVSHKLLVRAGMIRKVAMGIYDFLPLGLRSLDKIENIVREEMNRADAQEVAMPHLVPAELWQESGRWQQYGKELLRIEDRHEREYCFGPTHEEVVCEMVRHELKSYRDYPKHLYQIQTKFRDEVRPRFGLMRGREFLMKDGYSFHANEECLDREYRKMHATYLRIFERCGLAGKAVQADSGAIGGSVSQEFMILAETGEDAIASCPACDYAANIEKAECRHGEAGGEIPPALAEVHTPGRKTIDEVTKFLNVDAARMIKTLLYRVDDRYVIACVAGNREINEVKLKNALNAQELRLASDSEIFETTGVPTGFLGPVGIKPGLLVVYDFSVRGIVSAVTGANKKDHHLTGVHPARDLKAERFFDVASVTEGDACPKCEGGKLKILRGIEVGHIFKLGKKYAEPMGVRFLDEHGKEQVATMGCYGIGVSRTLAACVEQHHDDAGIVWPRAAAPYEVLVLTMGPEEPLKTAGEKLYRELAERGVDVAWDDREERAGVKFNDADLIGFPLQVILGKRGLEKGEAEYKIRRTGEKGSFPLAEAVEKVKSLLETLP
jgi:prolyl-tRNA synthetase